MLTTLHHLRNIAQELLDGTWHPSPDALAEMGLSERAATPISLRMETWVAPSDCGTSACIIGHGLMDDRTRDRLKREDNHIGDALVPKDTYYDDIARELSIKPANATHLECLLFMPISYAERDTDKLLREFIRRANALLGEHPHCRDERLAELFCNRFAKRI